MLNDESAEPHQFMVRIHVRRVLDQSLVPGDVIAP